MKRPVLIVENRKFDPEQMMGRLQSAGINHRLIHFRDGSKAFSYLNLCNRPNTPLEEIPLMMMIDINLPGIGGKALLHYAKRANRLKMIPVVILSDSENHTDVEHCYKMGANCYINKSNDRAQYERAIWYTFNYWFNISRVPHHHV